MSYFFVGKKKEIVYREHLLDGKILLVFVFLLRDAKITKKHIHDDDGYRERQVSVPQEKLLMYDIVLDQLFVDRSR